MVQQNSQPQEQKKSKTYKCMGSCQAIITEEQYNNGLTKCGAKDCSMYGQPFVEVEDSQHSYKFI